MKTLVIAEKPSVAQDLARALGLKPGRGADFYENDNYVISSAVGHLLQLCVPEEHEIKRGKWTLDKLPHMPPEFGLAPIDKVTSRLAMLKKLLKRKEVTAIVNACDAGREGELIFRNIIRASGAKQPIKRLWLQSMTTEAIRKAFASLRSDAEMLPLADTATFSPYRTDIGVTFSLNAKSGIIAMLGRLVGARAALEAPSDDPNRRVNANEQNIATQSRQMNAAGGSMRGSQMAIPTSGGWSLNLQYNAARQRPPRGGTQIRNDPTALCASQKVFGLAVYDNCIFQAQNSPATGLTTGQSAIGAPVFISPATQNVTSALTFKITQQWSAQWSTQYDVERNRFASQQVGLQRELHDWNAVFAFTQAPNGNFSFNFFIALKAQPELKFNYDRQTYRQSSF